MSEGRSMKYVMQMADRYAKACKDGRKEKDILYLRGQLETALKPIIADAQKTRESKRSCMKNTECCNQDCNQGRDCPLRKMPSEADVLKARAAELEAQLVAVQHGVQASVIAGAIFDFAGYLTTLPVKDAIHCSEAHEAGPMVEALTEWAKRRGLSLDNPMVADWADVITAQAKQDQP